VNELIVSSKAVYSGGRATEASGMKGGGLYSLSPGRNRRLCVTSARGGNDCKRGGGTREYFGGSSEPGSGSRGL
jgi:hypothetical protein